MSSSGNRDRFLVDEMLRHLAVVQAGVKLGKANLSTDATTRYALEHATELLAEAAEKTSAPFKTANPSIPWKSLRGVRHDVAHPYDTGAEPVNVEALWRFALVDCPRLQRSLRRAKFPRPATFLEE
jgi:uncharacterized protein with HEPN domain